MGAVRLLEGENIQEESMETNAHVEGGIQMVNISLCYVRRRTTSTERSETKQFGFVEEWDVFADVFLWSVCLSLVYSDLSGDFRDVAGGWVGFSLPRSCGNSMKYTKHEHLSYIADPDSSGQIFINQ